MEARKPGDMGFSVSESQDSAICIIGNLLLFNHLNSHCRGLKEREERVVQNNRFSICFSLSYHLCMNYSQTVPWVSSKIARCFRGVTGACEQISQHVKERKEKEKIA